MLPVSFHLDEGSGAAKGTSYTYRFDHSWQAVAARRVELHNLLLSHETPAPVAEEKRSMFTVDQVEQAGGYSVIYADPPWAYADKGSNGAAENHYPTLSAEQIRALPVSRLAAKDAVLMLWATYPNMPEALRVIDAWGFTYKTLGFQWVKTRGEKLHFGLGRWTRGNTEPCLLACRGKGYGLIKSHAVSQVVPTFEPGPIEPSDFYFGPVTRHSAKPPEVRAKIDVLFGDVPRLELFARDRAPGWDAWGNEVESDISLP